LHTEMIPDVPFLYKYSSAQRLDWLKPILLQHQLYFPNPNQLNDPKDARPDLALASEQAVTRFFVNDFLSRNRNEDATFLAAGIKQFLSAVPRFGRDALLHELAKHFRLEMETHRIYSLTTRPDNAHLWTRYAENHTGYCLEFKNEDIFRLALRVQYVDHAVLDVTDPEQITAFILFRKTRKWSDEEEVRIVLFPRGRPAVVPFAPDLLRRIILGRNMSAENRAAIRSWASARYPELRVSEEAIESTPGEGAA
jgi:hypothetical protein